MAMFASTHKSKNAQPTFIFLKKFQQLFPIHFTQHPFVTDGLCHRAEPLEDIHEETHEDPGVSGRRWRQMINFETFCSVYFAVGVFVFPSEKHSFLLLFPIQCLLATHSVSFI